MLWVYILECENGVFYVGQTKRLFRRFWEHQNGNGGINTSTNTPRKIVAIYKVATLCKFIEYDNIIINRNDNIYFNRCSRLLNEFNTVDEEENNYDKYEAENYITECLMLNNKNILEKIRGGKYTRNDVNYSYPKNNTNNIPLCFCGLPCDIKKNEQNNYLYFRCSRKNLWDNMKDNFDISIEPCKYFDKYTKDIEYRIYYEKKREEIFKLTNKSYWLKNLFGIHEFCLGGCGKMYDSDNTIRYMRKSINLCFDCFINKNDELSKKYNIYNISSGKCLLPIKSKNKNNNK